jgi:serine/threonine protein phosphatase PrpC
MEDRDVAVQRHVGADAITFLAVYDGHGGAAVADAAATELHTLVFAALAGGAPMEDAVHRAYAGLDRGLAGHVHTGSTASTVVMLGDRLVAAWVGDSQVIVGAAGRPRFVSPAHRLDDPAERARVVASGAAIDGVYLMRDDYGVMVTRALGDTWFRPVGVIATPALATLDLDAQSAPFVAVATDGLWDVLSADDVARCFAEHAGEAGFDYARALVDAALAAGTRDNVTVVTATWP